MPRAGILFALFMIAAPPPCAADRPPGPLTAGEERALKPKDGFRECDVCPDMVVVPAGSFTMGSPLSEQGRNVSEGPQFQVAFSQQFAVGKFAVTFAEWDACVADGGCNGYQPEDRGWGRGTRPVINVSWTDANSYVAWLSRKTGKTYRLPSESEREYVTRAGTTTPYWWGLSISSQQANYGWNHQYSKEGARGKTVSVDWLQPNPWGFYQVHGNVSEWVEDCWHNSYLGHPIDGSAWTTNCRSGSPLDRTKPRMIRGGSWRSPHEQEIRSASRAVSIDSRVSSIGFRVARALSP
jgi:formylglycine-generating enzyme required for sulfatase activity